MKGLNKFVVYIILTILSFSCTAMSKSLTVEIFTDSAHPVNTSTKDNVVIKYYNLDDSNRLMAKLNKKIGVMSPQKAKEVARQLIQRNQKQLTDAYKGLMLAYQYHIQNYPAIVFNQGEAVVYGVTDINNALQTYRLWRQKQ